MIRLPFGVGIVRVEESDIVEDSDLEEGKETLELTDNIGDPSVEIHVEELISELEDEGVIGSPESAYAARRRLEELMERKRYAQELADFDDYDI